ncbi:MAG: hypothetical protein M1834_008837 [Cirrosporium novae-zelandiae]|nr:MAG: hypothetical protein M1834_008837 [Cirrosporium novae-zelandiae]
MTHSHHILVLGATGATGHAFIHEALSSTNPNPPKLTLYVRTPSKLPKSIIESTNPRVRVVQGELTDDGVLDLAMSSGVDTVVSFLGAYFSFGPIFSRRKDTPIASSFPHIFQAMKKASITRILVLSTPSYRPPLHEEEKNPTTTNLTLPKRLYLLLPPLIAPQGNAEMVAIANAVVAATGAAGASFEYTVFRIPHLTNGSAELEVLEGGGEDGWKGGLGLSRGSLARWVLGEVEGRRWVGGCPLLGNC